MSVFVQNRQKTEMEIFVFCVITFEPIKMYFVVSIKRTGLLNYFEVFAPPRSFFHVVNEILACHP